MLYLMWPLNNTNPIPLAWLSRTNLISISQYHTPTVTKRLALSLGDACRIEWVADYWLGDNGGKQTEGMVLLGMGALQGRTRLEKVIAARR